MPSLVYVLIQKSANIFRYHMGLPLLAYLLRGAESFLRS